MKPYDELLLEESMDHMGACFRYAQVDCGLELDSFFEWFLFSGVASYIENGNPGFILGMSGIELADEVIRRTKQEVVKKESSSLTANESSYFVGQALAYFQWMRGMSFRNMAACGITPSTMERIYLINGSNLHRMLSLVDDMIGEQQKKMTRLAYYRKMASMTQKELAERSDVPVRMVQLYEQRKNNINKAGVEYVVRLAAALSVSVEALLEMET